MAEALFKKMIQRRPDLTVSSAGLQAARGAAASSFAVRALAEEGAKLSFFQSQPVTAELIEEATAVFAMTNAHLLTLLQRYPEHHQKFFLLNEHQDIFDPIGENLDTYRDCCAMIRSSLLRLLKNL